MLDYALILARFPCSSGSGIQVTIRFYQAKSALFKANKLKT
jgi:hypothetical protein